MSKTYKILFELCQKTIESSIDLFTDSGLLFFDSKCNPILFNKSAQKLLYNVINENISLSEYFELKKIRQLSTDGLSVINKQIQIDVQKFQVQIITCFDDCVFIGTVVVINSTIGSNNLKTYEDKFWYLSQQAEAFNQIADVTISDVDGNIIFVNDKFCEISEYSKEELVGQNHRILNSGLHSKEFFSDMWNTIKSGKPFFAQVRNKTKSGMYKWFDTNIVPLKNANGEVYRFVAIRYDITENKLLKEALEIEQMTSIHMSRLAALGEMASGIAHEIKNPLTVISGLVMQAQMLEKKSSNLDNKKLEMYLKINKHVERITKIIDGLRDFSRSGKTKNEVVKITNIIDSVVNLCSEKIKCSNIELKMAETNLEVCCYPIQIEQVLMNLICNSVDAIKDQAAPLWIQIDCINKGSFVEISVMDSGPGIPADIVSKIMTPFFTTKEIGQGTGLGLSISKRIIENHGGSLILDESSQNTRFVILIPNHV